MGSVFRLFLRCPQRPALMGLGILVGIAAALYPAHVAARVPPAEVVRAE